MKQLSQEMVFSVTIITIIGLSKTPMSCMWLAIKATLQLMFKQPSPCSDRVIGPHYLSLRVTRPLYHMFDDVPLHEIRDYQWSQLNRAPVNFTVPVRKWLDNNYVHTGLEEGDPWPKEGCESIIRKSLLCRSRWWKALLWYAQSPPFWWTGRTFPQWNTWLRFVI